MPYGTYCLRQLSTTGIIAHSFIYVNPCFIVKIIRLLLSDYFHHYASLAVLSLTPGPIVDAMVTLLRY